MDYDEWCKLPSTIKAMKILMSDWNKYQLTIKTSQLKLF
jgi:hypothetical protein